MRRPLLVWLTLLLAASALLRMEAARADNEIKVGDIRLERGDGGWTLDAHFDFVLNSSLEDAVNRGIPLYFTTDFELTQSRWYWFDRQVVSTSQSTRLWFQPLTRQYRVSNGGGLQLGFPTLASALALVRNVSAWRVIKSDEVKPGETYHASVRMRLDTALMPKPFQIDAVNNRDWNMSSNWKHFVFTPAPAEPVPTPAPEPAPASTLAPVSQTAPASGAATGVLPTPGPASAADHGK